MQVRPDNNTPRVSFAYTCSFRDEVSDNHTSKLSMMLEAVYFWCHYKLGARSRHLTPVYYPSGSGSNKVRIVARYHYLDDQTHASHVHYAVASKSPGFFQIRGSRQIGSIQLHRPRSFAPGSLSPAAGTFSRRQVVGSIGAISSKP